MVTVAAITVTTAVVTDNHKRPAGCPSSRRATGLGPSG